MILASRLRPRLAGFAGALLALHLALAPLALAQALDSSFDPNCNADVLGLAVQPDGKILLAGNFTQIGSVARGRVARLNADGTLDASFSPSPNSTGTVVTVLPDGKILLGGVFTTVSGVPRATLARLGADGVLDASFDAAVNGSNSTSPPVVFAIAVQPDGKILIGGGFARIGTASRNLLARLNADGSLDTGFDPLVDGANTSATPYVRTIALQSDGRILIGGNFSTVRGQLRNGAARLNADGSLDATFNPNPSSDVQSIAIQADGRFVMVGSFSRIGLLTRNHIARFNADGSLEPGLTTSVDTGINTVAVQADGKIVIGGVFSSIGTSARSRLARLNPDGSLDATFDPIVTGALGASQSGVRTIALPGPGQIIAGGSFTTVSGQTRNGIARLGSPRPVIVTQPANLVATAGANVTLSVVAVGDNLRYQWQLNGANIAGATAAQLALASVQAAQAGTYIAVVTNAFGTTSTAGALLALGTPPAPSPEAPLAIGSQPVSQHLASEGRAELTVAASGGSLAFQWQKNGVPIAGATSGTLGIANAGPRDMGFYTVVVTSGGSSIASSPAILTVANPASPGRLINVATRGLVQAGGALTPGFVLRGAGSKQLVARGVGPGLLRLGVTGVLSDPRMELAASTGAMVLTNDDWATGGAALSSATTAVGAFPLDVGSRDAAAIATLNATGVSAFTMRVTGPDANASGLALAEVYDSDALTSPVQIVNVSTRGFVGTGANSLVPGFVVGGEGPLQLLIRAIGPGLTQFGVPGVLADPQLEVVPLGSNSRVAFNDNWAGTPALAAAFTAAGAFSVPLDSKDAAVLLRLPPGAYTVVVSGVGGTTGTALVEIYDVP